MKVLRIIIVSLFFALLLAAEAYSQCPMCRMTVESNYAGGGSAGLGLNHGIMYLLAAPYLVVGTLAFFYWKNQRDNNLVEEGGEVKS